MTFVPRSLFEQFRRIANLYFLLMAGLMLVGTDYPQIFPSPLSPVTTLMPLCFVLGVTMLKEGMEDLKRRASDYAVNHRQCVFELG